MRPPRIAVIGPTEANKEQSRTARWVGRLLASAGVLVLTTGESGVAEAASRGAISHAGLTVGVLGGADATVQPPNEFVHIPMFTGLEEEAGRVLVHTAEAVVAIEGDDDTLRLLGIAVELERPLVGLGVWAPSQTARVEGLSSALYLADNPREAINLAIALARSRGPETLAEQQSLSFPP